MGQEDLGKLIEQDQVEVLKLRIGKAPTQFPIDGRDGVVPLLVAVRNNALQTAQWLLSQGASLDVRSAGGSTPLSLAAFGGHVPMVRALVDGGAKLGTKSPNGYQPLDWALENKHEPAFEALVLAWGLQDALGEDERAVLRAIAQGKPVKRVATARYSSYPLVLAIVKNQAAVVEQLLQGGLDPNLQNTAGYAPLPTAARLGRGDLVATLLRYRADPNLGGTPGNDVAGALNQAVRGLQIETARQLLAHGAKVNRGNAIGITPLYLCAVADQENGALTRLLLEHHADFTQVGQQTHDNAMDVALRRKFPAIVERLARAGAKASK